MPLFMNGTLTDNLYTIDRSTGVGTLVGSVSEQGPMAYDGENLYLLDDALYIVDQSNGSLTRVGSVSQFGVSEPQPRGLVWDGTRLLMTGIRHGDRIYELDRTTGRGTRLATLSGVSSVTAGDMAWDGETLFMLDTDGDRLLTVNPSNWQMAVVGSNLGDTAPRTLAWDGTTLFLAGSGTSALISLDRTTGAGTRIGMANRFDVNELVPVGMEWAPDAPTTPDTPTVDIREQQFEDLDEFTDQYDIVRGTTGNLTVVATDVEMLVEIGVDTVLLDSSVAVSFALSLRTYTPRYPVENVLTGDRIVAHSDDPTGVTISTQPIIQGGHLIGSDAQIQTLIAG